MRGFACNFNTFNLRSKEISRGSFLNSFSYAQSTFSLDSLPISGGSRKILSGEEIEKLQQKPHKAREVASFISGDTVQEERNPATFPIKTVKRFFEFLSNLPPKFFHSTVEDYEPFPKRPHFSVKLTNLSLHTFPFKTSSGKDNKLKRRKSFKSFVFGPILSTLQGF